MDDERVARFRKQVEEWRRIRAAMPKQETIGNPADMLKDLESWQPSIQSAEQAMGLRDEDGNWLG